MSTWGPIIAVVLALIAVVSVAVIAWQLSSDKFHKSLEEKDPTEPDPPA
jgi:hypothetical protein